MEAITTLSLVKIRLQAPGRQPHQPVTLQTCVEAIIASFHDLDLALHAKGGEGLDPDVKTAATQGPALPPFPTSGLVLDSKVPSSRSSGLVPAPKATAGRNAVPTQPTAHPFPPPFPSSGLDSAPGVLATVPQSGQTPRQALGTHSSTPLSGLDSIAPRVPAVFSQPASHPSSGLGPNALRVSSERPSRAHQGTTTGEAHAQVSDAPEVLAEELLKRPICTRAEVERLFDMLPKEVPPRREEGEAEGSSFSTGCYSKGGITGLRHNTTAFPMATKLLARFACHIFQSTHFTTLSLFDGVKTPMHRDSRNGPYPNGVCPISDFSGGHIWVEEEGGVLEMDTPKGRRPGRLLNVSGGPVMLEARERFHCTLPWQGRRLVLVAHVVAGLERLSADHGEVLSGLEFRLPDPGPPGGDETSEAHLAQSAKPVAVPFKPEHCGTVVHH